MSQRLAAGQTGEVTRPVQYESPLVVRNSGYTEERYTTSRISPRELTRESYTVPRERITTERDQRDQLYDILSPASAPRAPGWQLDPTDPLGIQGLLTQNNQSTIDLKIRAFEEMNSQASDFKTKVLPTYSPLLFLFYL